MFFQTFWSNIRFICLFEYFIKVPNKTTIRVVGAVEVNPEEEKKAKEEKKRGNKNSKAKTNRNQLKTKHQKNKGK